VTWTTNFTFIRNIQTLILGPEYLDEFYQELVPHLRHLCNLSASHPELFGQLIDLNEKIHSQLGRVKVRFYLSHFPKPQKHPRIISNSSVWEQLAFIVATHIQRECVNCLELLIKNSGKYL
jgi:hypothetical protein